MSRRGLGELREELEKRVLREAELRKRGDISSRIEADRLAKDIGFIKLYLEIWG